MDHTFNSPHRQMSNFVFILYPRIHLPKQFFKCFLQFRKHLGSHHPIQNLLLVQPFIIQHINLFRDMDKCPDKPNITFFYIFGCIELT